MSGPWDGAALAWRQWQDGDISDEAALRPILAAVEHFDAQVHDGEKWRHLWRERVGEIVAHLGGKHALPRYGELRITEPFEVVTFERKEIERIIADLLDAGDVYTAARINEARKVTRRPGVLQIRREKTKKEEKTA